MVEFTDGCVLAQLGIPDMRLPIQYALTYPSRASAPAPGPDFTQIGSLTFFDPDLTNTPCLALAMDCARRGGTAPAVLSAANEEAVALFLEEKIGFLDIGRLVEGCVMADSYAGSYSLEDVYACDKAARRYVTEHR